MAMKEKARKIKAIRQEHFPLTRGSRLEKIGWKNFLGEGGFSEV